MIKRYSLFFSKFLMAPAIGDACYAIYIIDECIRELEKEEPTETIKLPSTPMMEDDGF